MKNPTEQTSCTKHTEQLITAFEDLQQQAILYSQIIVERPDYRRFVTTPIPPGSIIDFADPRHRPKVQRILQQNNDEYSKMKLELRGIFRLHRQSDQVSIDAYVATPEYKANFGHISSSCIINFGLGIRITRGIVWIELDDIAEPHKIVKIYHDGNSYKEPLKALIYLGYDDTNINPQTFDPQIALQIIKAGKQLFDPDISMFNAAHYALQITELVREATRENEE